jgi:hypothetical protein
VDVCVGSIETKLIVSGVDVSAGVGLEAGGAVHVGGREKGVAVCNGSREFTIKGAQADIKIASVNIAIRDLVFIMLMSSLLGMMLSLDAKSFGL